MKKVFFIGICGISMSALAVLLKRQGVEVWGCDRNFQYPPACLRKECINVVSEDDLSSLNDCELVVYSSAIKSDHKAVVLSKRLKKKMISRGEMLGIIARDYEKVVAVAGSHGKTTTTAMIYNCLKVAGRKPTLHLGGILSDQGTNVVCADNEYFICEACEYFDNFLYLFPYISVVTNLEKEHLDYFKTFEREKASFEKFKTQSKIVVEDSSYIAKTITINKWGGVSFSVYKDQKKVCRVDMRLGGFYNIKNALYVFQVCDILGVPIQNIKKGLESFSGIQKRMERKNYYGKEIIVDYAHHPTEIKNCYEFLKKLPLKVRVIFQPHTYSRTKAFLGGFVKMLSKFDEVFIFETYPAREKPEDGLSALQLCSSIKEVGKHATYINDVACVHEIIKKQKDDEITLIMGAGDLPEKLKIY